MYLDTLFYVVAQFLYLIFYYSSILYNMSQFDKLIDISRVILYYFYFFYYIYAASLYSLKVTGDSFIIHKLEYY